MVVVAESLAAGRETEKLSLVRTFETFKAHSQQNTLFSKATPPSPPQKVQLGPKHSDMSLCHGLTGGMRSCLEC